MGALFQPDLFSASHPVFTPVGGDVARRVLAVTGRAFQHRLPAIAQIEQFGGKEINSSNFKLTTAAGPYLLKRLPGRLDVRVLERQLLLMIRLHDRRIAVPGVVRNDAGAPVTDQDDFHWCLLNFVDGDFFSGSDAELTSTAEGIGRLHRELMSLPAELAPPTRWDYGSDADAEIWRMTCDRRTDWDELVGVEASALLAIHWDLVLTRAAELEARRAQILSSPVAACHSDLHPHNILVHQGRLAAFLDFESVTLMPVAASLGYAGYKLMKQYVVSQRLSEWEGHRIADATRRFFDAMFASMGGDLVDLHTLRLMANAELFRRVLVVLRLNISEGNRDWNHVLPMHLAGLAETDVIFAQ